MEKDESYLCFFLFVSGGAVTNPGKDPVPVRPFLGDRSLGSSSFQFDAVKLGSHRAV